MPTSAKHPPSNWSAVKKLLEQALELPPSERDAFIANAHAEDAIRQEVLSLLAFTPDGTQHPDADFLSAPAAVAVALMEPRNHVGEQLGAWKIVCPLGSGGMGDVFEAHRADGSYEGRAAIKLLKPGIGSPSVLQRFAHERQALARLHHPHIATLLDAGLSADGLPYFVMEYVDGTPIDQAVLPLNLESRLQLFLQLTAAVSHAHKNLLVHGDLKPGNVLVTRDGQVKLLDFGISMALQPSSAPHSPADASADAPGDTASLPFTPHYASPEQVRGDSVSTATDVYSLGVLLYQVLTGVRPIGRDATTPAQAAHSVLTETPAPASSLPDGLSTDPQWLGNRKRLKGDLDDILRKSLEKSIERRYPSVEALAQDIQNYLLHQPVNARHWSVGYVLAKFVRRHRLTAALGAMLLLSLLAGITVSSWQAHQATVRLASIKTITREAVFRFGDAVTFVPGGMAIKAELLEKLTQVLDKLVAASGDDVDVRADAAQAYARLADIEFNENSTALHRADAGQRHADQALELARSVLKDKQADATFVIWYWRALGTRARLQRSKQQPDTALATLADVPAMLGTSIALAQTAKQEDAVLALRVERARSRHLISQILYKPGMPHLGRPDDALQELAAARAELVELSAQSPHPEITYLLGSVDGQVAIVHESRNALDDALTAAQLAWQERKATVSALPQDVEYRDALITESMTLGRILLRLNRNTEALTATQTAWDTNLQVEREHATDPKNMWTQRIASLAKHHAEALQRNGHPQAAAEVLARAEKLKKK